CHRPGLRKRLHPAIQLRASRRNRPFPLNLTTYIFDAVADRLLVNVEPNVIHMFVEEPPWLFSESTSPLSSAFCTPPAPRSTYIQTIRELNRCYKRCRWERASRALCIVRTPHIGGCNVRWSAGTRRLAVFRGLMAGRHSRFHTPGVPSLCWRACHCQSTDPGSPSCEKTAPY